jgi:hypothetical protein
MESHKTRLTTKIRMQRNRNAISEYFPQRRKGRKVRRLGMVINRKSFFHVPLNLATLRLGGSKLRIGAVLCFGTFAGDTKVSKHCNAKRLNKAYFFLRATLLENLRGLCKFLCAHDAPCKIHRLGHCSRQVAKAPRWEKRNKLFLTMKISSELCVLAPLREIVRIPNAVAAPPRWGLRGDYPATRF